MQDEVAAAEKSIDEKTNELVSKGRWMVPGYKVRRDNTLHPFIDAIDDLTPIIGEVWRSGRCVKNLRLSFCTAHRATDSLCILAL